MNRGISRTLALLGGQAILLASALCYGQGNDREISIRDVTATGLEGEVRVVTEMEFTLSDPVREAVNNGIPVTLVKQYAVPRARLVLQRRRMKLEQRFELRRHSLSDRYILTDTGSDSVKTYGSVADALRALGATSVVTFELPEEQYSDPPIVLVRAHLDIYSLPTALRLRAFISRSWRHSSGWTTWNIGP